MDLKALISENQNEFNNALKAKDLYRSSQERQTEEMQKRTQEYDDQMQQLQDVR